MTFSTQTLTNMSFNLIVSGGLHGFKPFYIIHPPSMTYLAFVLFVFPPNKLFSRKQKPCLHFALRVQCLFFLSEIVWSNNIVLVLSRRILIFNFYRIERSDLHLVLSRNFFLVFSLRNLFVSFYVRHFFFFTTNNLFLALYDF